MSLDLSGALVVGDAKDQQLAYHLPYSTGFGVGYRVTRWLDLRVEPKVHAWQVYHQGDPQDVGHRIASYKTFTLGLGAYHRWFPFGDRRDWSRGITVLSSVRWWPNVASTLDGDELTYANRSTGRMETIGAANIGIADTPFLLNVSLGYTLRGL
jgi:hypothetical protein